MYWDCTTARVQGVQGVPVVVSTYHALMREQECLLGQYKLKRSS